MLAFNNGTRTAGGLSVISIHAELTQKLSCSLMTSLLQMFASVEPPAGSIA